jgi:RNA polymerase sigma-70 factor (ECF subfamily)
LVRAIGYDATGCLQESEDLCQEIFLQAYRKLGQLRDGTRFPGWLVSIARRSAADWRRTRRQASTVSLEGIELPDAPPESTDEEAQCLLETLARLPAKEQMAVHLFYLAGEPASVARQALGLSQSGFYKILDRAKRRLAAILQRRKAVR